MRRPVPAGLLAALTACLALLGTIAAPASGTELGGVRVIQDGVQQQEGRPLSAAAAYDTTLDRHLVVWTGADGDATTPAVHGRIVTADGAQSGPAFEIARVGAPNEGRSVREVRAAYDPVTRDYLVVFTALRNASLPDESELYARRLDDQGQPLGQVVSVSNGSEGIVRRPAVVAVDGGAFVVAYEARRPSLPQPSTVVLQRVSRGANGPAVLPFDGGGPGRPSLAAHGPRLLVAAMRDGTQVEARFLTPNLDPVAGPFVAGPGGAADGPGPLARYHPGLDRFVVAAAGGGTLTLTDVADAGPLRTRQATLSGPATQVDVLPVSSTGRWIALTGAAGGPLAAQELDDDGGAVGSAELVDGAADARELAGASSVDATRGWLLTPFGAGLDGRRQVLARIVAPAAPLIPPAPEDPSPVPQPRCLPGARLYVLELGSACDLQPVPAFEVRRVRYPRSSRRADRRLGGLEIGQVRRRHRIRIECVRRCGTLRTVLKRPGRSRPRIVRFRTSKWRLRTSMTIEVRVERTHRVTRFQQYRVTSRPPYLRRVASGCRLGSGAEAAQC